MEQWQCCRMCLGVLNLHPIFTHAEHHEKYSQVVLEATGVQITMNDALPHLMCATCIKLTNETYKFRRKCQDTQKSLAERLSQNTIYNIKVNGVLPDETKHSIDITDLIADNNDLNSEHMTVKEDDFDNDVTDSLEDVAEKFKVVKKVRKDFDNEVTDSLDNEKIKVDKKVRQKVERRFKEPKRGLRRKEEIEKTEIECEYCHKILTSKLSLRNHYKIHTGFDVVCEHCGKKFITRRLLIMHCKAKHGYEKTDKCSFCDYRASNAEQVKIHERLHTGEKPYVCATCGVGFHRKSSYLQHVAIHLPEKTVQCTQCPARFKSVTLMRIHANRHRAAQYTYKCVVCKHNFARRRNVARHLLRIHAMQPLPEHIERSKCV